MKLRWITLLYTTSLHALPLELGVVSHPLNEFPEKAAVGIGIEAYDALYSERSELYEEDIILAGSQYRIDYRGLKIFDFWQLRPQVSYRNLEYTIEPIGLDSESVDTRERSDFSLMNRWRLSKLVFLGARVSVKDQSRRVSNFSTDSRERIQFTQVSVSISYQQQERFVLFEFRPGFDKRKRTYRLAEPDRYQIAFYLPFGSIWGLSGSSLVSLHEEIDENRKDNFRQQLGLERDLSHDFSVGMALDYESSSYANKANLSYASMQVYAWSLSSKIQIYEDTELDFRLAMRYGSEQQGLRWDSQVIEASFTHFLWDSARKENLE